MAYPCSGGECCNSCADVLPGGPLLCGAGRTQVYGAERAECERFRSDAEGFDGLINEWTTVVDAVNVSLGSGEGGDVTASLGAPPAPGSTWTKRTTLMIQYSSLLGSVTAV